jgi:hypothetical protein
MATSPARRGARAVKDAVRQTLDRHPRLLKNNRLYYELERARAYHDFHVDPTLTDRPDLLDALVQRGIAVVPDFISQAEAQELRGVADATLSRAQAGELDKYVFTTQPEILCRIGRAHEVAPETTRFFDDPVVTGVFRAYMSARASSYRRELDYRYGLSKSAQADLYHFDNWRPICKAFLYLDDVTIDQAPFVYVPGSHKQDAWRRHYNLTYDVDGVHGRFGHFFPQEMNELRERFGWEDLVCEGQAGTLILADLRGLHRGTPLKQGRRVMLTNAFDLMSQSMNGH